MIALPPQAEKNMLISLAHISGSDSIPKNIFFIESTFFFVDYEEEYKHPEDTSIDERQ